MGTSKFETSILMVITMIAANASHNVTILTLKVHGTTKVIYIKGPLEDPTLRLGRRTPQYTAHILSPRCLLCTLVILLNEYPEFQNGFQN